MKSDNQKLKTFLGLGILFVILVYFLGVGHGRTEQENEMYKQMYQIERQSINM